MAFNRNEIVCTPKSGTPITFTVKHKGNASPPAEAASTTAASTTAASSNGSASVAPVVVNAAKAAAKTAANDPTKAAAKVAAKAAAAEIVTATAGIVGASSFREAVTNGRRFNEALVRFNEAYRKLDASAKPVGKLVGVKPDSNGSETQNDINQLGTRAKAIAQTIAKYAGQVESMGGGRRKTHKKHGKTRGKRSKTHKKHGKRSRKHRRM